MSLPSAKHTPFQGAVTVQGPADTRKPRGARSSTIDSKLPPSPARQAIRGRPGYVSYRYWYNHLRHSQSWRIYEPKSEMRRHRFTGRARRERVQLRALAAAGLERVLTIGPINRQCGTRRASKQEEPDKPNRMYPLTYHIFHRPNA
jgi:hypothetical protein